MTFKVKSKQHLKINHIILLPIAIVLFFATYSFMGNSFVGAVSPLERCERNDIENSSKCKREYRDCNSKHRNNSQKRDQCKEKAIRDNKKPQGGGGLGCQMEAGTNQCRPSGGGGGGGGGNTEDQGIGKTGDYICGTFENDSKNVHTKFDFGCLGTQHAKNGKGPKNISPILDLTYAFVRFLSVGVGIVLAAAIIISGIQYSMSEGNAETTQRAKARIRSAVLGLAIYIFAFSMLQYLVPGGVFNSSSWVDESILQLIVGTTP